MLGMLTSFFSGMFSSNRMQDVAIDGLRKIGGLDDMNPREKSEYILSYMNATKHQSPVRRLIALTLTALYSLVVAFWLVSSGVGYLVPYVPAQELSGALKMFMESVLVQPFNIILAFYFVTQMATKFGGK